MARVFTITPGLENMGALKTGGQGSVYKGRRTGEIITAIKLLPTPIYSESEDNKSYRDFTNEVQKLYRVNEVPNPNVVKILSSGLSETGNFPYIEMDFIEGPDLEELLQPPHDPIFTIKEVSKVAEQLSNALAHCHSAAVKHGDIKSNNVKFNQQTGNYVLLDFGLAVMSDEQRRTSLRQAGAIEFMAPEQNEGQMLFETDVYSFGVILFELLAGRVPFPLQDKGETARNVVRLLHQETPPPDVLPLRAEAIPATWTAEKKEREMRVPDWLLKTMYTCLAKNPEHRFRSGKELHDHIVYYSTHMPAEEVRLSGQLAAADSGKQVREKEMLHQQILQYRQQIATKDKEIIDLKARLASTENEEAFANTSYQKASTGKGVSKPVFTALLLLTLALGAFSAYQLINKKTPGQQVADSSLISPNSASANKSEPEPENVDKQAATLPTVENRKDTLQKNDTVKLLTPKQVIAQNNDTGNGENGNDYIIPNTPSETVTTAKPADKYQVLEQAYFYTSPDESTRRKAYMVPSDNAILKAVDDQNGFIYVVFTNQNGQTSRGWLRKSDLKKID